MAGSVVVPDFEMTTMPKDLFSGGFAVQTNSLRRCCVRQTVRADFYVPSEEIRMSRIEPR